MDYHDEGLGGYFDIETIQAWIRLPKQTDILNLLGLENKYIFEWMGEHEDHYHRDRSYCTDDCVHNKDVQNNAISGDSDK